MLQKVCPKCSTPFETEYEDKIYCTLRCRRSAINRRYKRKCGRKKDKVNLSNQYIRKVLIRQFKAEDNRDFITPELITVKREQLQTERIRRKLTKTIKDGTMSAIIALRLYPSWKEEIRKMAQQKNISMSDLIFEYIKKEVIKSEKY